MDIAIPHFGLKGRTAPGCSFLVHAIRELMPVSKGPWTRICLDTSNPMSILDIAQVVYMLLAVADGGFQK